MDVNRNETPENLLKDCRDSCTEVNTGILGSLPLAKYWANDIVLIIEMPDQKTLLFKAVKLLYSIVCHLFLHSTFLLFIPLRFIVPVLLKRCLLSLSLTTININHNISTLIYSVNICLCCKYVAHDSKQRVFVLISSCHVSQIRRMQRPTDYSYITVSLKYSVLLRNTALY